MGDPEIGTVIVSADALFEVTLRPDEGFVDVSVGFISVSSVSKGPSSSFPGRVASRGGVILPREVQSGAEEGHILYEN